MEPVDKMYGHFMEMDVPPQYHQLQSAPTSQTNAPLSENEPTSESNEVTQGTSVTNLAASSINSIHTTPPPVLSSDSSRSTSYPATNSQTINSSVESSSSILHQQLPSSSSETIISSSSNTNNIDSTNNETPIDHSQNVSNNLSSGSSPNIDSNIVTTSFSESRYSNDNNNITDNSFTSSGSNNNNNNNNNKNNDSNDGNKIVEADTVDRNRCNVRKDSCPKKNFLQNNNSNNNDHTNNSNPVVSEINHKKFTVAVSATVTENCDSSQIVDSDIIDDELPKVNTVAEPDQWNAIRNTESIPRTITDAVEQNQNSNVSVTDLPNSTNEWNRKSNSWNSCDNISRHDTGKSEPISAITTNSLPSVSAIDSNGNSDCTLATNSKTDTTILSSSNNCDTSVGSVTVPTNKHSIIDPSTTTTTTTIVTVEGTNGKLERIENNLVTDSNVSDKGGGSHATKTITEVNRKCFEVTDTSDINSKVNVRTPEVQFKPKNFQLEANCDTVANYPNKSISKKIQLGNQLSVENDSEAYVKQKVGGSNENSNNNNIGKSSSSSTNTSSNNSSSNVSSNNWGQVHSKSDISRIEKSVIQPACSSQTQSWPSSPSENRKSDMYQHPSQPTERNNASQYMAHYVRADSNYNGTKYDHYQHNQFAAGFSASDINRRHSQENLYYPGAHSGSSKMHASTGFGSTTSLDLSKTQTVKNKTSSLYVSNPDFTKHSSTSKDLSPLRMKPPDFSKLSQSYPASSTQDLRSSTTGYNMSPPCSVNASNFAEISKKYNYISDLQLKNPSKSHPSPVLTPAHDVPKSSYNNLYVKAPDFSKQSKMEKNYQKPISHDLDEPTPHVIHKNQFLNHNSAEVKHSEPTSLYKNYPQLSQDVTMSIVASHQQHEPIDKHKIPSVNHGHSQPTQADNHHKYRGNFTDTLAKSQDNYRHQPIPNHYDNRVPDPYSNAMAKDIPVDRCGYDPIKSHYKDSNTAPAHPRLAHTYPHLSDNAQSHRSSHTEIEPSPNKPDLQSKSSVKDSKSAYPGFGKPQQRAEPTHPYFDQRLQYPYINQYPTSHIKSNQSDASLPRYPPDVLGNSYQNHNSTQHISSNMKPTTSTPPKSAQLPNLPSNSTDHTSSTSIPSSKSVRGPVAHGRPIDYGQMNPPQHWPSQQAGTVPSRISQSPISLSSSPISMNQSNRISQSPICASPSPHHSAMSQSPNYMYTSPHATPSPSQFSSSTAPSPVQFKSVPSSYHPASNQPSPSIQYYQSDARYPNHYGKTETVQRDGQSVQIKTEPKDYYYHPSKPIPVAKNNPPTDFVDLTKTSKSMDYHNTSRSVENYSSGKYQAPVEYAGQRNDSLINYRSSDNQYQEQVTNRSDSMSRDPMYHRSEGGVNRREPVNNHRTDSTVHRSESVNHRNDSAAAYRSESMTYRNESMPHHRTNEPLLHRSELSVHRSESVAHRVEPIIHRNESVAHRTEVLSHRTETAPYRTESTPYRSGPSSYRNEAVNHRTVENSYKSEPVMHRNDLSQRSESMSQRNESTSQRTNELVPYRSDSVLYKNESVSHRNDPIPYRNESVPHRNESVAHHRSESSTKGRHDSHLPKNTDSKVDRHSYIPPKTIMDPYLYRHASEADLNYQIIKKTLNKDISIRRSDTDLSRSIFDNPKSSAGPLKASPQYPNNADSYYSREMRDNAYPINSQIAYHPSSAEAYLHRNPDVKVIHKPDNSKNQYRSSQKSVETPSVPVPVLKTPHTLHDQYARKANELSKHDLSVTVSRISASMSKSTEKVPTKTEPIAPSTSGYVNESINYSKSAKVKSEPQSSQAGSSLSVISAASNSKSTSVFGQVKRESPLDLSVKTVKTSADSTGCDDYSTSSSRWRDTHISPSLKVDFAPNFQKHTRIADYRKSSVSQRSDSQVPPNSSDVPPMPTAYNANPLHQQESSKSEHRQFYQASSAYDKRATVKHASIPNVPNSLPNNRKPEDFSRTSSSSHKDLYNNQSSTKGLVLNPSVPTVFGQKPEELKNLPIRDPYVEPTSSKFLHSQATGASESRERYLTESSRSFMKQESQKEPVVFRPDAGLKMKSTPDSRAMDAYFNQREKQSQYYSSPYTEDKKSTYEAVHRASEYHYQKHIDEALANSYPDASHLSRKRSGEYPTSDLYNSAKKHCSDVSRPISGSHLEDRKNSVHENFPPGNSVMDLKATPKPREYTYPYPSKEASFPSYGNQNVPPEKSSLQPYGTKTNAAHSNHHLNGSISVEKGYKDPYYANRFPIPPKALEAQYHSSFDVKREPTSVSNQVNKQLVSANYPQHGPSDHRSIKHDKQNVDSFQPYKNKAFDYYSRTNNHYYNNDMASLGLPPVSAPYPLEHHAPPSWYSSPIGPAPSAGNLDHHQLPPHHRPHIEQQYLRLHNEYTDSKQSSVLSSTQNQDSASKLTHRPNQIGSSLESPQNRPLNATLKGADQTVISKLRNNLEMKEIEKQKMLKSQCGSDSMADDESNKSDIASLIAARIRTKGELKGFTPISSVSESKPEIENFSEEPVPEVSVLIETCSDLDEPVSATPLDLMDWGSACNDFVEQLQSGTMKRRGRRKRAGKTSVSDAKLETVEQELPLENLPGVDYKCDMDESLVKIVKSENKSLHMLDNAPAGATVASSSSDEDMPLHMLRQQSLTDNMKVKEEVISDQTDKDGKSGLILKKEIKVEKEDIFDEHVDNNRSFLRAERTAILERLSEKISRHKKEQQREKREHEKRISLSSSSDSEVEANRPLKRPKKVMRKLRTRASVEIKHSSAEDSSDNEVNTIPKTTPKNDSSPEKRKKILSSSSETEQIENNRKNLKLEKTDHLTVKQSDVKISSTEKVCSSMKVEKKDDSSDQSSESESKLNDLDKSRFNLKKSSSTVESKIEETMTRSKRKRELENQIANSKILRNEKVIKNIVTPDRKSIESKKSSDRSSSKSSEKGKSFSRSNSKIEESKRKILDSDNEELQKSSKKKTSRVTKLQTSSSENDLSEAETVIAERTRTRKGKISNENPEINYKTPDKVQEKKWSRNTPKKGVAQKPTPAKIEQFPPGWEEQVYEYKRSLKVPPRLITVGRPPTHRKSVSLPDLDPHSSDASETFVDNKRQKPNEPPAKRGRPVSSQKPPEKPVEIPNDSKTKSIIDLLHQRVIRPVKNNRKKERVINNGPKITPQSNEVELLQTPGAEGDVFKQHHNVFETAVLKSRTRKQYRMQKNQEIIREVFGGDDRPASAPPEQTTSNDVEPITFDQKYRQYLEKMNIDFGEKIRKHRKPEEPIKTEDPTSTSSDPSSSIPVSTVLEEKIDEDSLLNQDDETQDTEINECERNADDIKVEPLDSNERDDTPSVLSERDGVTPNSLKSFKGKKARNNRSGRRKGSSGFDYIRKKKKPIPPTINTTGTPTIVKRREAAINYLEEKDENDINREIRGWVLNKGVGESVLHKAARLGYIDVIAFCLERLEMLPDQKDNAGYTPLHEACSRGRIDIARLLLMYGAYHSETAHSGIRPLHEAAENGYIEIVRLLLSFGADPLLATYSGQTPIMLAENDEKMTSFLKNYLQDIQNTGPYKLPWRFEGSWRIYDPDENGYNVFDPESLLEDDSIKLVNKIGSIDVDAKDDEELKKKTKTEACDSNSNIMYLEATSNTPPKRQHGSDMKMSTDVIRSKYKNLSSCSVVLNNIDSVDMVNESNARKEMDLKKKFDYDSGDDQCESGSDGGLFEFEESEMPHVPLYHLRDEGSIKWALLTDLCYLLKVKSKDTLLKQICPSNSPSNTSNKELLRELKMSDFLEKATCLQLLCAGEKLNIRSSKVILVKYNDSVKNLLGVKTVLMRF